MGDGGHLPVPPEREDEVRARCGQHLAMIREGRGTAHLGRAPRDQIGVGVLNSNQVHVRHGDEVAQVGRIVERMPVAYLNGGDANGHSRPVVWRVRSPPRHDLMHPLAREPELICNHPARRSPLPINLNCIRLSIASRPQLSGPAVSYKI